MRSSFLRLTRRCFSVLILLVLTGLTAAQAQPPTGGPRPSATPTPVNLLNIIARNAGTRNQVAWTVANEHNLAAYQVERSADGVVFDRMAQVAAAGKSDYSVYDPAPNVGRTYYRLIMANIDGSTKYSKTVQAFLAATGDMVVLSATPNPVQQELCIAVSGVQYGQVSLIDMNGRQVRAGTLANGTALLQTGALAPGQYVLHFSNGSVSKTIKVTKQ
ncbi:MAG: T9SS type A sorting domain-containing protein [Sphingobacteriales bacterium]|nr:MAG: T9SS type A sorting domain-containing protein [Sphingobacteriales bacterium]